MRKKLFVLLDVVLVAAFFVLLSNYRTQSWERNEMNAKRLEKYRELAAQMEEQKTVSESGVFAWTDETDDEVESEDEMIENSTRPASVSMVYHITNDNFWDIVVPQKSKHGFPAALIVNENEQYLVEDSTIKTYLQDGWELMISLNLNRSNVDSISAITERADSVGAHPQAVLLDSGFESSSMPAVTRELEKNEIHFAGSLDNAVDLSGDAAESVSWWRCLSLESSTDELIEQIKAAEEQGAAVFLTDYSASGNYSDGTHFAEERLLDWLQQEQTAGRLVMTQVAGYEVPASADMPEEQQEELADEETNSEKTQEEISDEIRKFLHREE